MAEATFTVTMDENLKKQFDMLCEKDGLTASAVINKLARKSVRENRIPINISLFNPELTTEDARKAFYELRRQAAENGLGDMTMEEIDEEIRKTRYGE